MQRRKIAFTISSDSQPAGFERSPGAVSTHNLDSNQAKNGQVYGPAASERLGNRSQFRRSLVGERSRLRLVNALQWRGSEAG